MNRLLACFFGPILKRLESIDNKLDLLIGKEVANMKQLDDLTAEVKATTDLEQSAITHSLTGWRRK